MKLEIQATPHEINKRSPESVKKTLLKAVPAIVDKMYRDTLKKAQESAKTPAEPHERIRGSKKNKKGSASSGRSGAGIEISDEIESALKDKVKAHNEKASEQWKRVTLGDLKAVFRRGAGAFSASHRPSQNRQSWAYARVNAFLKIANGGGNPKYTQDNDLLSPQHPRRKKEDIKKAVHSCGCDTMQKGPKRRGGEIDLILELSEQMTDLYKSRLSALEQDIQNIIEDKEQ